MTTLRIFRVLVPLAMCITLVGCGGSEPAADTAASGGDAAGSTSVDIKDLTF